MILKLDSSDVERSNVYQDKLRSQWLEIIPCLNLRLELSIQHLRIAIGLGSKIIEKHRCVCGRFLTEDGRHSLSCFKMQGDSLGIQI